MMALLSSQELRAADALARIGYCNPFVPERLALERTALGTAFRGSDQVLHLPPDADRKTPDAARQAIFLNFAALRKKAESLTEKMRSRLLDGAMASDRELGIYRDMALLLIYSQHMSYVDTAATGHIAGAQPEQTTAVWKAFEQDFDKYLHVPGLQLPAHYDAGHCFAVFFQIQRAFDRIFECIIGRSMPVARLRAAVWESIFTHDMGRYTRALYRNIGEIPTLITGHSGTGKELVAQAIGMSRYIPFNARTERFEVDSSSSLYCVNLSALSPTLIESELFGHKKGAFTGAVTDRRGWLEFAGPEGTVFLDEIGDLDLAIQVKLLRVLQSGSFSRVGDTRLLKFAGKFVAATNCDLSQEMASQRFREDLYYRLCADMIHTPTLREQVADRPADLHDLTAFIARRLLTDLPDESHALAQEAVEWIETHLGTDYPWPGNIRELEQCVRNVMIRKSYTPAKPDRVVEGATPRERLAQAVAEGQLSLKELTEHYVSMVYAGEGRYDQAAKRLGMDWRTLQQKLNPELVKVYSAR